MEILFPRGLSWSPGEKQSWTVRITEPDTSRRFGFQLTTRPQGELTAPAGSNTAVASGYIYHTASQSSYTVEWTPPQSASGEIAVYVAALTGRGTSNSNVYTATYTLERAGAAPPQLSSSHAVVNGASFTAPISPGAWTTIFGENLAPPGVNRIWRAEEIVNGVLPVSLEGVSVRINNKPAAMYYVSGTQLNVLSPDDAAVGTVSVEVTTPAGTSAPAQVTMAAVAPGLFAASTGSRSYAAALSATYELIGAGQGMRAARPGETILLYGTGFGARGDIDRQALRVTVGGVDCRVAFAGRVSPGLYQLNVEVPEVGDGEHLLVVTLDGVRTQEGLYLAVRRP